MNEVTTVFGSGYTHKVTLVVPSTRKVSVHLTESAAQDVINRCQRFMANLAGGATAQSANGAWISESGELVIEPVTLVYSFFDSLTIDTLTQIKVFVETLKWNLEQESFAVEIDGQMIFL